MEKIFECHTNGICVFDDFIKKNDCFVFPTVCRAADQIVSFISSFHTAPMFSDLKLEQNSLHDVKMNARLASCSCYDICVSASYNQWQVYIYIYIYVERTYARLLC